MLLGLWLYGQMCMDPWLSTSLMSEPLYTSFGTGENSILTGLYSKDLKSRLVWIWTVKKEVGLQMVWILMWIWNLDTQQFEIQTNGCNFVKNHLKSRQKCPNFEWSSFRMDGTIAIAIAKARPFEKRTIWNIIFNKSGLQSVSGGQAV